MEKAIRDKDGFWSYRGMSITKTNRGFARWAHSGMTVHAVDGSATVKKWYANTIEELAQEIDKAIASGDFVVTKQGLRNVALDSK